MNVDNQLKLIETIFDRFRFQTQIEHGQLSRDYFERFSQLLKQTFAKYSQLKSSIEKKISSIIYPYHSTNLLTFEYQLRLIRFSLQQQLQIHSINIIEFFHHSLLLYSSLLRHLALQIGILVCEQNFQQQLAIADILQLFASDPNLYVQNTLAQFLAIYLIKHQQYDRLEEIPKSDLLFNVLLYFDDKHQELFIKQFNLYDNLSDTPARRMFVLKTAKFLIEDDQLTLYLNRLLEKSISDYVYMLFSIVSIRPSSEKLKACLKALFLYIEQNDIEEIDEDERILDSKETYGELMEYICCYLYEKNMDSNDLALIVLENLQSLIKNSNSFIYQYEFYSSTIVKMFNEESIPEKNFALLINCYKFLPKKNPAIDEKILDYVQKKKRSTIVYQAFFHYIDSLESIQSIIEFLLFQEINPLYQWDHQDCVFQFCIQLIKTHRHFPSWFQTNLFQRILEHFISNNNEYIQGSLIDFFATLIEYDLLSPFDQYLTTNFIQLTQYSLGDVVRCALAHAWFVILIKSKEIKSSYRFSFGTNIDSDRLKNILLEQIPLLIGDGGQETEIQCLKLIQSLGIQTKELENVLDFLSNDGCSNDIKDQARQLLSRKCSSEKINEILEDEYTSILHWLEHPDEHLVLDCD